MAIGSNTLGLLFKIGVDPKDAIKALTDIKDAAVQGLGEGAVKGAKDFEKAMASNSTALKNLGTNLQQARAGVQEVFSGDVIQGTINLTRSLGPLGIALAGIAAAAAAVGFAIKGAIDAAHDIGTTSKDDFDALQKKVQSAGESITEVQRAMAGGILDALDKISGATTAFFAKLIEKDGKALILLLQDIAKFIRETLMPLVDEFAGDIEDAIVNLIAAVRSIPAIKAAIDEQTKRGTIANLKDTFKFIATGELGESDKAILDIYKNTVAGVRKELEAIHPAARTLTDDHAKATKALKDLTEAQLEQNEAARALALERAKAAGQEAEIDRLQKANAISIEEALGRRLAVQQNLRNAEDAFLDAEEKRINAEVKGENRRKDALEAVANARKIVEETDAARQAALAARADDDADRLLKKWEALRKFYDRLAEEINDFWFKQSLEINKAIDKAVEVQPEGGGVGASIIQNIHDQADALDPLTKAWREVKFAMGEFLQTAIDSADPIGVLIDGLMGMAHALEVTFQNFILTGQLGAQAIKSLTATILAQLAIESFFMVLKENARAAEETAAALADLAWGDYVGFTLHSIAAAAHHKAAITWGLIGGGAAAAGIGIGLSGGLGGGTRNAAAGGGFGGEGQAPGTVTINQGAAIVSLGIAVDNLNNKLQSMRPEDVLTVGAERNPVAIGQANNEAARRDGTVSRQFLEIAGLRPA